MILCLLYLYLSAQGGSTWTQLTFSFSFFVFVFVFVFVFFVCFCFRLQLERLKMFTLFFVNAQISVDKKWNELRRFQADKQFAYFLGCDKNCFGHFETDFFLFSFFLVMQIYLCSLTFSKISWKSFWESGFSNLITWPFRKMKNYYIELHFETVDVFCLFVCFCFCLLIYGYLMCIQVWCKFRAKILTEKYM